ncbi:hypothetical protein WN48_04203 [Eufriesea mexicana]|uniref:Uncharacterized protein n=1 Tax=Eufriesea mexicana TaxID=516756 RepID=A0A310SJH1_9HYME|nr:hypothetical protein WN48_04203 [Eufriesea mexicana]
MERINSRTASWCKSPCNRWKSVILVRGRSKFRRVDDREERIAARRRSLIGT